MAPMIYAKNLDKINPIRRDEINRICKYLVLKDRDDIVRKLVVFGSSTTERATEESDVDIAVEFFYPETRYLDGALLYEKPENNSFLSWARSVTLECGMSLIDIDNLRMFPSQYLDGIEQAVENGIVVYEKAKDVLLEIAE